MSEAFNTFFATISSLSTAEDDDCITFFNNSFNKLHQNADKHIFKNFKMLKNNKLLNTGSFKFKTVSV